MGGRDGRQGWLRGGKLNLLVHEERTRTQTTCWWWVGSIRWVRVGVRDSIYEGGGSRYLPTRQTPGV
eukprot:760045-Hanusia_phi.AAC.1